MDIYTRVLETIRVNKTAFRQLALSDVIKSANLSAESIIVARSSDDFKSFCDQFDRFLSNAKFTEALRKGLIDVNLIEYNNLVVCSQKLVDTGVLSQRELFGTYCIFDIASSTCNMIKLPLKLDELESGTYSQVITDPDQFDAVEQGQLLPVSTISSTLSPIIIDNKVTLARLIDSMIKHGLVRLFSEREIFLLLAHTKLLCDFCIFVTSPIFCRLWNENLFLLDSHFHLINILKNVGKYNLNPGDHFFAFSNEFSTLVLFVVTATRPDKLSVVSLSKADLDSQEVFDGMYTNRDWFNKESRIIDRLLQ